MFGQKKKTLIVEGMMCEHCAAHVEDALKKLDGVKSAKVELMKKSATVKLERDITPEEFKEAIAGAGYKLVEVQDA